MSNPTETAGDDTVFTITCADCGAEIPVDKDGEECHEADCPYWTFVSPGTRPVVPSEVDDAER